METKPMIHITHEDISSTAYRLHLEHPDRDALTNWLEAEKVINTLLEEDCDTVRILFPLFEIDPNQDLHKLKNNRK